MKLKQLALAAAAFAALSGGAQANIVAQGGNGSLFVYAFDTVTSEYYVRDLGFLMNSFLPGAPYKAADAPTFTDVATDAGANLNAGNTASFADAAFAAWAATKTNVLWAVGAVDNITVGAGTAATEVQRLITSSPASSLTVLNPTLNNYTSSGLAGGFDGDASPSTGLINGDFNTNFQIGASSLSTLDSAASLYLVERERGTLGNSNNAIVTKYENSLYSALVSLESDGDFSYTLAPAAVPLPGAIWLMGAGLAAMGGFMRRRAGAALA